MSVKCLALQCSTFASKGRGSEVALPCHCATQMIWRETQRVGCAVATASCWMGKVHVCHYDPVSLRAMEVSSAWGFCRVVVDCASKLFMLHPRNYFLCFLMHLP